MILGITGSRFYKHEDKEYEFCPNIGLILLKANINISSITKIISGNAIGFDKTFEKYFQENFPNIEIERVKPKYLKGDTEEIKRDNKYAPILRNKEIVEKSDFILGVASHKNSKGTESTIEYAKKCEKPYIFLLDEFIFTENKYVEFLTRL